MTRNKMKPGSYALLFLAWCIFYRDFTNISRFFSSRSGQGPALLHLKPHTPPCWLSQSSREPQTVPSIHPSSSASLRPHSGWRTTAPTLTNSIFVLCSHTCFYTVYRPICVLRSVYLCVWFTLERMCVCVSWLDSGVFRNLGSAHIPEAHMIYSYIFLFFLPLHRWLMRNTCPSCKQSDNTLFSFRLGIRMMSMVLLSLK